jgi:hypothetical protein
MRKQAAAQESAAQISEPFSVALTRLFAPDLDVSRSTLGRGGNPGVGISIRAGRVWRIGSWRFSRRG